MAARRRRTNNPPAEPTHEEMIEVAAEREAEPQVEETPEDEETAIEVLMAMAAADTFEAIWEAEKEKGVDDFFDPTPAVKVEVRPPAVATGVAPTPSEPTPLLSLKEPRYLLRQNNRPNYRRG